MIKKLKQTVKGFDDTPAMPTAIEFFNKINELVDVVNEIQTKVNKMGQNINFAQPEVKENVQDLYAEQRKWIGKLCRCWDSDINDDIFGILQDIKDNKTEKYYMYGIGYEHCEPVKPDDDIIYKDK